MPWVITAAVVVAVILVWYVLQGATWFGVQPDPALGNGGPAAVEPDGT